MIDSSLAASNAEIGNGGENNPTVNSQPASYRILWWFSLSDVSSRILPLKLVESILSLCCLTGKGMSQISFPPSSGRKASV